MSRLASARAAAVPRPGLLGPGNFERPPERLFGEGRVAGRIDCRAAAQAMEFGFVEEVTSPGYPAQGIFDHRQRPPGISSEYVGLCQQPQEIGVIHFRSGSQHDL
jgi:hypothetical protein